MASEEAAPNVMPHLLDVLAKLYGVEIGWTLAAGGGLFVVRVGLFWLLGSNVRAVQKMIVPAAIIVTIFVVFYVVFVLVYLLFRSIRERVSRGWGKEETSSAEYSILC